MADLPILQSVQTTSNIIHKLFQITPISIPSLHNIHYLHRISFEYNILQSQITTKFCKKLKNKNNNETITVIYETTINHCITQNQLYMIQWIHCIFINNIRTNIYIYIYYINITYIKTIKSIVLFY
jgi:hypothetical protein